MRLLIDGIFFQLASTGITRVWTSIISRLVARNTLEIFILDRGGMPVFAGATHIPFPSYKDRYTADDSLLIHKICVHYEIDVFSSTYYTTPLMTPMALVIYDMIPEVLEYDLSHRFWQEKALAISFAQSHICISQNTKADLLRFYPELDEKEVVVAYPGVDSAVFKVAPKPLVAAFRKKIGYQRPYMLLVGSREQHKGYKNARLFFEALRVLDDDRFDILCVGGESEIDQDALAAIRPGVRIERLLLSDAELVLAYGGARALVYPSLYEGFGLPVVEAMASGCPVITTRSGSLHEVAGDACLIVDGHGVPEMVAALQTVQQPLVRKKLIASGLERAREFSWEAMLVALETECTRVNAEHRAGAYDEFFRKWTTLRDIQSSVDIEPIF